MYVENLLTEGDTAAEQSKTFWSYVKHKHVDTAEIGTIQVNSHLLTTLTIKAEALNNYFYSVFFSPTDSRGLFSHRPPCEMTTFKISERGMHAQRTKPNLHKATGRTIYRCDY